MKILFPFKIKQTGDKQVEFTLDADGRPIVAFDFHPAIRGALNDAEGDRLCEKFTGEVVKAVLKVEY